MFDYMSSLPKNVGVFFARIVSLKVFELINPVNFVSYLCGLCDKSFFLITKKKTETNPLLFLRV